MVGGTDPKEKKEVEIDIVGVPTEGNEYVIGSCKYKNEPVGADEYETLKHYASIFGKSKKIPLLHFFKERLHPKPQGYLKKRRRDARHP